MSIIVGFSRSKSPWKVGSTVIQKVENRPFSHVYIKYQDPITGVMLIAQAGHGFIHEISETHFNEKNIVVKEYLVECKESDLKNVLIFIKNNLGIPYSTIQILLIGVLKIFKTNIKSDNKDAAFICSEFAARVCTILGIGVGSIKNLDTFTPSDMNELMLKLCKESPNSVRLING